MYPGVYTEGKRLAQYSDPPPEPILLESEIEEQMENGMIVGTVFCSLLGGIKCASTCKLRWKL